MGARKRNPRMDFKWRKLHHLPAGEKSIKNSNHSTTDTKEIEGPTQRIPKNSGDIASCINGNPEGAGTIHSHMGSNERMQQRLDQTDTDSQGDLLGYRLAVQRNCEQTNKCGTNNTKTAKLPRLLRCMQIWRWRCVDCTRTRWQTTIYILVH